MACGVGKEGVLLAPLRSPLPSIPLAARKIIFWRMAFFSSHSLSIGLIQIRSLLLALPLPILLDYLQGAKDPDI